jgi:hypothetical protein
MNSLTEMTQVPGSERARRASEDPGTDGRKLAPDPEVTERPQRRRFTAEYKLRIVREADACKGDGDVGALLRREYQYSGLNCANTAAGRCYRYIGKADVQKRVFTITGGPVCAARVESCRGNVRPLTRG